MQACSGSSLWRWWAATVTVTLLMAAAFSGIKPAAAETASPDPEPFVDPDMPLRIPPGPGWPEGWKPPDEPTEIPKSAADHFNFIRSLDEVPDRPERLDFRVMRTLPGWTKTYPYFWTNETMVCGKTLYAIVFPAPDTGLLYEVSGGDQYSYSSAPTAPIKGRCQFVPITHINVHKKPTVEEQEQMGLGRQLISDTWASRGGSPSKGGLDECRDSTENGTLDRIMVCFNDGDASRRFDAPAYLDSSAGRVRVPLRFISEMMGGKVTWDPENRAVTILFSAVSQQVVRPTSKPGFTREDWWTKENWVAPNYTAIKWEVQTVSQQERQLVLFVGKEIALVDGLEYHIDAPPVIQPPGRVMVPVRFIAEALGAKVYWIGAQPVYQAGPNNELNGRYQVHLYTVFHPFYEYPNWVLENKAQKF